MAINHNLDWLQLRSYHRLHENETSHRGHVARLTFMFNSEFISLKYLAFIPNDHNFDSIHLIE